MDTELNLWSTRTWLKDAAHRNCKNCGKVAREHIHNCQLWEPQCVGRWATIDNDLDLTSLFLKTKNNGTIKINKSMGDVDIFKTTEECVMRLLASDVYPRFVTATSTIITNAPKEE